MIHRNLQAQQEKGVKIASTNQRQYQRNRYRYLIDLPDYSAVVQNPQSMKNLGRSEASLLEKIVFQNDPISSSSVFEQNKEKIFDTRVVDEMKFSFNNNQSKDKDSKQSNYNELVTKYHNQYSKISNTHKNEAFIKKTSKQIHKEQSININMEKIKSKYNGSKQLSKTGSKIKIIDEQKQLNQLDSFSKNKYAKEGGQSQRHLDKAFQKVVIKDKKERDQIIPLTKQLTDRSIGQNVSTQRQNLKFQIESTETPHLQKIFQTLDLSKTGKIEKNNCGIKYIKEQFQLIFGVVFYRIKFCNDSFNKKDFINLCLQCLKLLRRQKILSLFKQQDEALRQKSNSKQEKYQRERILKQKQRMQKMIKEKEEKYKLLIKKEERQLLLKQKEQREKMLKERQQRQRRIKQIEQKERLDRQERSRVLKELAQKQNKLKLYKQSPQKSKIDEDNTQRNCQNCKSASKLERKYISHSILQDSPPKQRTLNAQQSFNISKKAYVEVKEAQSQRQTRKDGVEKIHHPYKYETNPLSSHAIDSLNSSLLKQKKAIQIKNQAVDYQKAKSNMASNKKKRNISQQILREHKKSLNQIHKLNDKVQQYISSQPPSQRQSKLSIRYYESLGIKQRMI